MGYRHDLNRGLALAVDFCRGMVIRVSRSTPEFSRADRPTMATSAAKKQAVSNWLDEQVSR